MRAAIIRSGSISPQTEICGLSSRSPAGACDVAVPCYRRSQSTRMFVDVRERKDLPSPAESLNCLRRARSDNDLLGSVPRSLSGTRWSPPAMLVEEGKESDIVAGTWKGVLAAVLMEGDESLQCFGGGKGKGKRRVGGSGGGGGNGENSRDLQIGKYYQEMLRADPGNPLILRNYARFLHEVEGDYKKAEEFYGRAILASPGDGEVLSLYARLIWEFQRDRRRAETYYELAVKASPDDCCILSSYAQFLWEAEEGEDEGRAASSSPPFVEAF